MPAAEFRARRLAVVLPPAAFVAGAASGWSAHPSITFIAAVWAVAAGLVAIAAAAGVLRTTTAALVVLLIAAGLLRGTQSRPSHQIAASRSAVGLSGTASSTDSPGVVVDVDHIAGATGSLSTSGRVLLSGRGVGALLTGDRVTVVASGLRSPGRRPGARSLESLERDDVDLIATVTSVSVTGVSESWQRWVAEARSSVRAAVDGELPARSAAVVLGVAMGIHETVDAATRTVLQDAGLYHIVAVSGLKVIIVLGLLDSIAAAAGVMPRRRRWIGLAGIALYVAVSGAGAAALRSSLMAALTFAFNRDGRRVDPFVGLAGVAALLSAIQPHITADVGFQLSFLGTAGILLLTSRIEARIPLPRVIAEPLAVTVAAQVATLPVMAGSFGTISLGGPVANALVLPLLPLMVALGIVGSVLAPLAPPLAWLPLHVAAVLVDVTVAVATVIAAVPGAAIHVQHWPAPWVVGEVAGLVAGSALVLQVKRVRALRPPVRVAVAACIAALTAVGTGGAATALTTRGPVITVLDVGAATSVLVETSAGRMLVNAGSDAQTLDTALGRVLPPFDTRIDLLVISTGDRRAIGGLQGLVGRYDVGAVMLAAAVPSATAATLEQLRERGTPITTGATAWRWGDAIWRCAGGDPGTPTSGCMLSGQGSGWRVLLSGVAPPAQQDAVAGLGLARACDLVVAPPGGALSQALLDGARPRFVAEPTGAHGRGLQPGPGIETATTGGDGDLAYAAAPETGMVRE